MTPKMAFGTDIVINLPGLNRIQSNFKVLENRKAAGIPSADTLQCITINAPELLGVENARGVLDKNYYEDIIALKNNPLDNIDAIKTVQFVMKEGKVIKRD